MGRIAVDIGTTTVAMSAGGREITFTNPQREAGFGHDVISRIRHAVNGHGAEMQRILVEALILHGTELSGEEEPLRFVISANTVMQHILFGDSCEGLSTAPFAAVTLSARSYYGKEAMERLGLPQDRRPAVEEIFAFPGISPFVGGDVVSGLYALELLQPVTKSILFVDLGTNGEMVLLTPRGGFAASAAAGPAFEAANISCGKACVPGVISKVEIRHGRPNLALIPSSPARGEVVSLAEAGAIPSGVCGSAVIDTVYELLKHDRILANGTFRWERDREEGFPLYHRDPKHRILFTQEDVRAVQTAKAAVRAGLGILMAEAGITEKDVDRVFLAGSFGSHLTAEKLCGIGLFPESFLEKLCFSGNTSLQGALKYAEKPEEIPLPSILPVSLAEHRDFERMFINEMNFKKIQN